MDELETSIPAGYAITSYILLMEVRTCECCNAIYSAPAHSLRVELVNYRTGATRTVALADMREFYSALPASLRKEFSAPILPRKIKQIYIDVAFCPSCFHSVSVDQKDLLQPEIQLLSLKDIKRYMNLRELFIAEEGNIPSSADMASMEKQRRDGRLKKKMDEREKKAKRLKAFNLQDFL